VAQRSKDEGEDLTKERKYKGRKELSDHRVRFFNAEARRSKGAGGRFHRENNKRDDIFRALKLCVSWREILSVAAQRLTLA
jgi:hypothetical protein